MNSIEDLGRRVLTVAAINVRIRTASASSRSAHEMSRAARWEEVASSPLHACTVLVSMQNLPRLAFPRHDASLRHPLLRMRNLTFADEQVNVGLFPAAGGVSRLPKMIGVAQAVDLILSGRSLKAKKAESTGLVHKTIAADTNEKYDIASLHTARTSTKALI